jgi:hypothetical protein
MYDMSYYFQKIFTPKDQHKLSFKIKEVEFFVRNK